MFSFCRSLVFFCAVFLASQPLFAADAPSGGQVLLPALDVAPDVLIRAVTEEVIAIIKDNQASLSSAEGQKMVAKLIEDKVAPHFDFTAMTKLAVGRYWRDATEDERRMLTEEFRRLLVRTYAQVLLSFRDSTVVFKPLRMAPDATDVIVRLELKQGGVSPIAITLAMEKSAMGWKIYDVTVDLVSLVTTYRGSFASKIRESGIEGLIRELSEKNHQLGR